MAETFLRLDRDGPIANITLANPERRNPLSIDTMLELQAAFEYLGADRDVHAIVMAAEGPVFSAGHDLREMVGADLAHYRHVFELCTNLMTAIQNVPQPVIAQVDGLATAAGCQLVATCDLVVASEDSRFATPGVKLGLFCSTPMVALSRAIGRKRALEMLMTGRAIDAKTAAEWGLVNRVVPSVELSAEAQSLALQIASASSLTVGIGKQAFYSQIDLDQAKAYAYTKEVMSKNAVAGDAQEGMCAFLEKRDPVWQGR